MEQTNGEVVVVCHPTDEQVGSMVCSLLEGQGFSAVRQRTAGAPPARGVVPVISSSSIEDERWLGAVEALQTERLVPVALGEISSDRHVPDFLREINWILWRPGEPTAVAGHLLSALTTDLNSYWDGRRIEDRALAWLANGRSDEYLIEEVHASRDAERAVASGAMALRPENAAVVGHFVGTSLRRSRRDRRRRRWRVARTAAAVVALVAVPAIALWNESRQAEAERVLSIGSLLGSGARPDLAAVKSVGLQILAGDTGDDVGRDIVAKSLYSHWDTGTVSWKGDYAINDVALTEDDHLAFTVDGQGAVSRWDIPNGAVMDRVRMADTPFYGVSATRDGRWLAAATSHSVYLTNTSDWSSQSWDTGAAPSDLAIGNDGLAVAVSTSAGVSVATHGRARLVSVIDDGTVLDIAASGPNGLLGLVDRADRLEVVDLRTGRVREKRAFSSASFPAGAVGPNGQIAVVGADQQIWYSSSGLRLKPTGQAVPDVLSGMAITDRGWVVTSSRQFGVQVIAPEEHLLLGSVCRPAGLVESIRTVGSRGICGQSWTTFDMAHMGPLDPDVPLPDPESKPASTSRLGMIASASLASEDNVVSWSLTADADDEPVYGELTLAPPAWPPGTLPTAVAVSPDGAALAVGTNSGWVVELSARHQPDVGRWGIRELGRVPTADRTSILSVAYQPGSSEIVAETAVGHYSLASCAGCDHLDGIVDRVSERRWNMYSDELLRALQGEVRERLRLQPVPLAPEARTP